MPQPNLGQRAAMVVMPTLVISSVMLLAVIVLVVGTS
jgi:hypothetical protein